MKHFLSFLCLLAAIGVYADSSLTLSNVRVQQRYPWNGLVDISFDVTSSTPCAGYLHIEAQDLMQTNRVVILSSVSLDGVDYSLGHGELKDGHFPLLACAGTHHLTWDSMQDLKDAQTSLQFSISVQPLATSVPQATGCPTGICGDVAIIDLEGLMSEAPAASHVALYTSADIGTLNCDAFKTTKLVLRRIPAGNYYVGRAEVPVNAITLTQPYYLGIFEVTRQQFLTVTGRDVPADKQDKSEGLMAPINAINFVDFSSAADGFCARLNARLTEVGAPFSVKLPTEAQWEVAARAGTISLHFFGAGNDELRDYAWTQVNANGMSHTVGLKKTNPWGFYDVYGNVNEFVVDEKVEVYPYGPTDPLPPVGTNQKFEHIVRGGGWYYGENDCSQKYRGSYPESSETVSVGYRLAAQ